MIIIKRIITSAVGILILIPLCIFSDTIAWPIGISVISVIAVYEMLRCIGADKIKKYLIPSVVLGLSPLFFYLLKPHYEVYTALAFIVFTYIIVMIICSIISPEGMKTDKLAEVIFYCLFVAIGFTFFSVMKTFPQSGFIIVMSFLGAWCSDTFALCGGLLFGKHKLCPQISPKKTVEGSLTGILFNIIFFVIYGLIIRIFYHTGANLIKFAIFGAALSVISQFGDLFMSRIKRNYGIKDYGTLFPGHGGALDRFDSVLLISYFIAVFNILVGVEHLFI